MTELDRCLKQLHSHLSNALTIRQLRDLGWFDFRLSDHPDDSDPLIVAVEAFIYLAISSSGNWNEVVGVVTAVVAFLNRELRYSPLPAELASLRDLLLSQPVNQDAVRDWFDRIYAS